MLNLTQKWIVMILKNFNNTKKRDMDKGGFGFLWEKNSLIIWFFDQCYEISNRLMLRVIIINALEKKYEPLVISDDDNFISSKYISNGFQILEFSLKIHWFFALKILNFSSSIFKLNALSKEKFKIKNTITLRYNKIIELTSFEQK